MLTIKKPIRMVALLASLAVGVLLCGGCKPPGARALLDGKRLIEEGKYDQAVGRLQTATQLLSTNAHAWNYFGLALHGAGKPAEAQQAYRKALTLDQNLLEARFNLGTLLLEQNNLEAARAELTAFTLQRENSAAGWLKLAAAQLRLRDLAGAERSYARVLGIDRQNAEAWNGLGVIQVQRNRARDAAQYFNAALQYQPGYPPALLNVAVLYHQHLNNRALALQKYKEYLALKPLPANWQSVQATARQLEEELKPAPARPAPVAVARVEPETPRPAEPAPKVEQPPPPKVEKPEPSPTVAQAAPTKPPSPLYTGRNPAPPVAKEKEGEPKVEQVKLPDEPAFRPARDVASTPPAPPPPTSPPQVASANIAVSPRPEEPGFLERINPANLFRREPKREPKPTPLDPPRSTSPVVVAPAPVVAPRAPQSSPAIPAPGQEPGARYQYLSPARPSPGNRSAAERHFADGVAAQRGGRLANAIAAYEKATEADPGYFEAHYNLGLAAYEAGNLKQSLRAYEMALAIDPDSPTTRYNFALALRKANHPRDAARELERLLSDFPGDTRAHLALANLYAQDLQQPRQARAHYLRVLEFDPRHPEATDIRYWLRANP